MVPIAEVPPQDIGPWRDALGRLLTDRGHYEEIARQSREAAMDYARKSERSNRSKRSDWRAHGHVLGRSTEACRPRHRSLRKRSAGCWPCVSASGPPPSAWFPGIDTARAPRLFWFPHAGGGTNIPADRRPTYAVAVRLPGRESRLAEAPFTRMAPLVDALATAIEPHLDRPFAFFGHSMGAVVAFELARAPAPARSSHRRAS